MTFDFKAASIEKKGLITSVLVDDLMNEGLRFVYKDAGIWKEMEHEQVIRKVRKNLRDCGKKSVRTGKRKAGF